MLLQKDLLGGGDGGVFATIFQDLPMNTTISSPKEADILYTCIFISS